MRVEPAMTRHQRLIPEITPASAGHELSPWLRAPGAPARVWGQLLDVTVGCGYRPWLAGIWLLALTLLGTLAFGTHSPAPVKLGEGSLPAPHPHLDLLVPIGALGQRTGWYWSNDSLQWPAYLLIAFGCVLTTAVIAGVTRAQKDQAY
ncbi:hypothetical protein [Streptomyces sp. LN549]|uniref:hypothetical protein n=1 Tax=Streptomyces sp. LN549 TaxID=3112979 RepID=UPI00371DA3FE